MDIKSAVKTRMKEKGMNATELAKLTGYTVRHVYDLLSGGAGWNEKSLDKVCRALDMTVEFKPLQQTGTES